jgi:hypothetical protein
VSVSVDASDDHAVTRVRVLDASASTPTAPRTLPRTAGTAADGTWSASWSVSPDNVTHVKIEVTDGAGQVVTTGSILCV